MESDGDLGQEAQTVELAALGANDEEEAFGHEEGQLGRWSVRSSRYQMDPRKGGQGTAIWQQIAWMDQADGERAIMALSARSAPGMPIEDAVMGCVE
jgi:hypothetical protein